MLAMVMAEAMVRVAMRRITTMMVRLMLLVTVLCLLVVAGMRGIAMVVMLTKRR